MPSDAYCPPGGLINHPPIHNQLCISLSDPTPVTTKLLNSRQVAHQRKQEEAVNSKYQPSTNAMRFLTKIRSFCTISFVTHRSPSANSSLPACISLYHSTLETTEVFTLPQVARQRKQEEAINSNRRPGETPMRYLTKICTSAFGKLGSLSTNCDQPSYNFLSDALETIVTIHSFSSLATTDADDTFVTADDLSVSLCPVLFCHAYRYRRSIHVSNLSPLASEVVREELYTRGYLKRPNQGNRFLRHPRCIVVPRLLQVLHDRWPKQVAAVPVSSKNPQHPSPRAIGRRGGLTVAEALKVGTPFGESCELCSLYGRSLPILRRILINPLRRDHLLVTSQSTGLASHHKRPLIHLHLPLSKKVLRRPPSFAISVNTRTSRRILHLPRHRSSRASLRMRRTFWV